MVSNSKVVSVKRPYKKTIKTVFLMYYIIVVLYKVLQYSSFKEIGHNSQLIIKFRKKILFTVLTLYNFLYSLEYCTH